MSSDALDRSMSSLSLNSADSQPEDDWDRSLILDGGSISVAEDLAVTSDIPATVSQLSRTTPRNSIIFPADGTPGRATHYNSSHSRNGSVEGLQVRNKKRTLSDLLKLHSEKGSNHEFSIDEAKRIADVLGQWVCSINWSHSSMNNKHWQINASSSPYEGEDDFFMRHAQDDITLNASGAFRRVSAATGRPRGKSETVNANQNAGSRPSSILGATST
jgi:hypothetical protein